MLGVRLQGRRQPPRQLAPVQRAVEVVHDVVAWGRVVCICVWGGGGWGMGGGWWVGGWGWGGGAALVHSAQKWRKGGRSAFMRRGSALQFK